MTLRTDGAADRAFPLAQQVALLGVAQEALTNVRKHASPTQVCVSLHTLRPNSIELIVEDDGCGFDPAALDEGADDGHFGIASMRARIEELGGSLRIASGVGCGAIVTAVLPLTAPGDRGRAEDQRTTRR